MKNHGCHPFGNAKARAVVWNFPDGDAAAPRADVLSPRPDMIEKYPTHDDVMKLWRLPTMFKSMQQKVKDVSKHYPLVITSGRLVEYEGGGEETRSNPWLAELQQEMFIEVNPKRRERPRASATANTSGSSTPVQGARIKVKRPGHPARRQPGTCLPARSISPAGGRGKDMLAFYPEGAAPVVRGEAVNTATTYGYDSVTMMQETKTTLCRVSKA
jgi:formate dehydrogenase major subunit